MAYRISNRIHRKLEKKRKKHLGKQRDFKTYCHIKNNFCLSCSKIPEKC